MNSRLTFIIIIVTLLAVSACLIGAAKADTATRPTMRSAWAPQASNWLEQCLRQKNCRILRETFYDGLMYYLALDNACKSLEKAVETRVSEQ